MAKLKLCKHCGNEVAKSAKSCPKCGGRIKGLGILPAIAIIAIIIVIVAVAANEDKIKEDYNKESFSHEITKQYSDGFSYYVEGTVNNLKDKEYSYVQIEFVCYDKDGNNIGTAIDNTNNLLGKETWKFKAIGLFSDAKADHCDYHDITSW